MNLHKGSLEITTSNHNPVKLENVFVSVQDRGVFYEDLGGNEFQRGVIFQENTTLVKKSHLFNMCWFIY